MCGHKWQQLATSNIWLHGEGQNDSKLGDLNAENGGKKWLPLLTEIGRFALPFQL
jgi:hypothetical protein